MACLERLMPDARLAVPFYVCTGRHVIDRLAAEGRTGALESRGIVLVADTCVVVTPILAGFDGVLRSEEHTSELQSLMRISYAVFCLQKKKVKTLSRPHNKTYE